MNRVEKYMGVGNELLKSGWFWCNVLFVLLGSIFIPYGFFCIFVAIGFNILRGELKWGSELSIKYSTAGYIMGLVLYFVTIILRM